MILEYLIKYYLGTTKDLYAIWKAAKDFEVNAFVLEEKLLCQILFSESFVNNGIAIFSSYYKSRPDGRIVRAFLAFLLLPVPGPGYGCGRGFVWLCGN